MVITMGFLDKLLKKLKGEPDTQKAPATPQQPLSSLAKEPSQEAGLSKQTTPGPATPSAAFTPKPARTSYAARKRKGEYLRLEAWIDSRIGPVKGKDEDILRQELLKLVEEEESSGSYWNTEGLRAYIDTNAYRQMLEK